MKDHPSLDLVEYVETKILPRYAQFDKAHNLNHVIRVIKDSLELAKCSGADINMVYTVAAYHDLGLGGPRAIHHINGAKILAADRNLLKWFSASQIDTMKGAVEDHRATASHAPRSIYGKIVAEADRDLDPVSVFTRTIQFDLNSNSNKTKENLFSRFCYHLEEKYSSGGYLKLWITGSPNEKKLNELRSIISNPTKLRKIFNEIYEKETKEKNDTIV
jgi:uncharacterized protein